MQMVFALDVHFLRYSPQASAMTPLQNTEKSSPSGLWINQILQRQVAVLVLKMSFFLVL